MKWFLLMLWFLVARGRGEEPAASWNLRANRMHWKKGVLELEGEVHCQHLGWEFLAPSSKVILQDHQVMESLECPSCRASWKLPGDEEGEIECPGPLSYHAARKEIQGEAVSGKRVTYRDSRGTLLARKVTAQVDLSTRKIKQIFFEGDVRYRAPPASSESLLATIQADRAKIEPDEDRLTLESAPPHCVTVWSRHHLHSLRCQALCLWKDSITQQWQYQGLGSVQVSLARKSMGARNDLLEKKK